MLCPDEAGSSTTLKFEGPATGYAIRQLTAGAAYRLRVKSWSFLGESNFTDFIHATVRPSGNAVHS